MNNSATDKTNNQTDAAEYEQALDYLYSFINFEAKKQDRYMASKLDHTRPGRLMDALANPHTQFPAIHIAGTKGKGSTAAICAYTLRAAGYTVGLYTSPHLQDFRERVRILTPDDADGRISKPQFIHQINNIRAVEDKFPDITWFEILTAIAFLHFAAVGVDIAVVEVGLGGRLDATNVLTPLVSVITRLSFDHTDLLGNTLTQIAHEKGGIIKAGIPVITANQEPEAAQELLKIATEREVPISIVGKNWEYVGGVAAQPNQQTLTITHSPFPEQIPPGSQFSLPLGGDHQLENATVALAALQQVQPHLPKLTLSTIQAGLSSVRWPGRLDIIHPGDKATPTLLVDCAHNPDAIHKLRDALHHSFNYNRLWLIFGAPADKDVPQMLADLLPLAHHTTMTTASHPRSATPEQLAEIAAKLGFEVTAVPDMATALTTNWQQAQPGDLICVTGSIIVVGDLLNQWESLQSQLLAHQVTHQSL
ncbi:bifunctional folylpolyglutamate synthase/dihydrofolate synthase [Candidatus Leptofilum sp.]|uniref:bifunctional folylpolyglutamate synthase/dihydrofolate synthase n=1 Tax=Candidatus Leptofilum sp. TaxID=3241576 RepID=UPI003B5C6469